MANPDVLILGGGIIGCSLAVALSQERLRLVVVERGRPGEEASGAAAGMLAPTSEPDSAPELASLAAASAALYPGWVEQLREKTSLEVGYRSEGTLVVATQESEERILQDLPGEKLRGDQLRKLEPALSDRIRAGCYLPGDHQVDNRRLMQALVEAATRAGVEFRTGSTVARLWIEADRARGVGLEDGTSLASGLVVNAAGCWAGRFPEVGSRLTPTRPIRGQMIRLASAKNGGKALLRHVVRSPRAYLVPRTSGEVLVGSTMEDAGYEKKVTARALGALIGAGLEIAPGLAELPFAEAWAGLRPDTPDHLPILGATDVENYFVATGHFRNGILLAPITARLLTQVILGRKPELPLEPFSPLRFAK